MLVKVGSLDLTQITGYKVKHIDKTRDVESAAGFTTVYVISEKVEIEINLGALTQNALTSIMSAMSNVTFTIQFLDVDGTVKQGTFKRSDRENGIKSYINSTPWWDESTITLTSLGGVTSVTS